MSASEPKPGTKHRKQLHDLEQTRADARPRLDGKSGKSGAAANGDEGSMPHATARSVARDNECYGHAASSFYTRRTILVGLVGLSSNHLPKIPCLCLACRDLMGTIRVWTNW